MLASDKYNNLMCNDGTCVMRSNVFIIIQFIYNTNDFNGISINTKKRKIDHDLVSAGDTTHTNDFDGM